LPVYVRAVSRLLPVAGLAALIAVALSGCGTIDADKLEDEIAKGLDSDLQQFDTSVASVSCPDEIESETGAKFDCAVTTDGDTELIVNVEVTSGDDGDVEYKLSQESIRELTFGGAAKGG
jgi:hypothetical protein